MLLSSRPVTLTDKQVSKAAEWLWEVWGARLRAPPFLLRELANPFWSIMEPALYPVIAFEGLTVEALLPARPEYYRASDYFCA